MKKKIIALTMAATLLLAPAAYAHGGHHGAHHAQQYTHCAETYSSSDCVAQQHDDGICLYPTAAGTTSGAISFSDLNTAGVQNVIRHCQRVLYMPRADHCAHALNAALR